MDNNTFLVALTMSGLLGLAALSLFLSWLGRRDAKRGETRLAELAHMNGVGNRRLWQQSERFQRESKRFWEESEQFWRDHVKFWERADKRWADHEALMRKIFERVDRDKQA